MSMPAADKHEVVETISRHLNAYDGRDFDACADLLTEDTVTEGDLGEHRGRRAHRGWLPRQAEGEGGRRRHLLTNPEVDGDGDRAEARWIVLAVEAEGIPAVAATAAYEGEFRRVGGRWLISRRRVSNDPSLRPPV